MRDGLLPLFPLPLVLLPQNPLPLHIFEERYREMIGEAIADDSEFGIVMAAEGGIVNVGCTATIERVVERFDDGRLNIATLGRRRFEVLSLNEDRAFLRGEVSFFDDVDETAQPNLAQQAIAAAPKQEGIGPLLSFDLGREVRDVNLRQQLLVSRSENDRLRLLIDFFPAQSVRDVYKDRMKVLAVRNGHGKHGPGANH
jgi:ATP-dependent protease La (LON) substrate-binding domain